VSESIDSLAYNPDGSELLAGDANGNVELLGATTHAMIGSLPGDGSTIYGMAVSPAGSTLATVDSGGTVQLWDLNSRFPLGTPLFAGSAIFSLDYSANGSQLVTGDMAGTVVLWPSLLWKTDLHVDSQDLCPRLRQNLTANQWNEYVSGQPYLAACPGYPKG
jgi:WD40 repeat protein